MRLILQLALAAALATAPGAARALDILLSNDDGQSAPGIQALRAALCAAGHHVTLVGPATDQSGRGGSINTGALSSSAAMALTRVSTDACGTQYSLAAPTTPGRYGGTPVDSVKTGFDVVLAGDPPDLVVSGLNFGQNMSKEGSNTSGTVGAALAAAFAGFPAIAGSVGVNFAESQQGFPSTTASFAPASAFIVQLIATLEAQPGPALMPKGVKLLNVNFPVPYTAITGVAVTKLADHSDLALPLFDRNLGFPPIPGIPSLPNCLAISDGQSCSIGVGVTFPPGPDTEKNADTDAHRAGKISVTPMDGDMTTGGPGFTATQAALGGLTP